MSLATWKAEFYPVEASKVPAEDAAAHSLRKWEGLLPEVMKRYGVAVNCGHVVDSEFPSPLHDNVAINADTCALCESYWQQEADDPCATCPLAIAREGASCSHPMDHEDLPPWTIWCDKRDPVPMIHWLRVTVEGAAA